VVVTGSTTPAGAAESITNVQERGVDEGDIVKRIGDYLIVLQDGRLFTVNIETMAVSDRINVYRPGFASSWIDEMLVFDNRILVTGYSYAEGATELSIFTLAADGSIDREGVYYLSSADYYDSENYATRIIGDQLVFYAPVPISILNPDQPIAYPTVRRLIADADTPRLSQGRPLFAATDIYRPLIPVSAPMIHVITVCPLGEAVAGDELDCHAQGFISSSRREFYVTPRAVYLWTLPDYGDETRYRALGYCDRAKAGGDPVGFPGVLYEAPIAIGAPRAATVQGAPLNQFAMAMAQGEFRALAAQQCSENFSLLSLPNDAWSVRRSPSVRGDYAALPDVQAAAYEVRFTDAYLVYAGRPAYGSAPPSSGRRSAPSRVIAVPIERPGDATVLAAPHGTIRLERLGNDMVLTGYQDRTGLALTYLDLGNAPALQQTYILRDRFETEGRSHAFNSRVDADGSGLIGIPTAGRDGDPNRRPWESADSDVSFLRFDAAGRLSDLGALAASENAVHPDYRCEVSCVDWYGNARPIFTDGRIFALTGAELVEGRLTRSGVAEVRRVNLTQPPPRRSN
jgi:hypothetical protein